MVESQPSKLLVAGSIPVSRSNLRSRLRTRELRLASQTDVCAGRLVGRNGPPEGGPPCRYWFVGSQGDPTGAEADVAQLAERVLGKDEVTGSIPVIGSIRLTASPRKTRRMP